MDKKLIFIFFIFLFSLSFISAQPSTTIYSFPEGYTIVPAEFESLKVNEDFYMYFYLYNSSTGLKIDNTTVECDFHLANSQGNLVLFDQEAYQPEGYWYAKVNGSYVNETGYYYYGIDCSDGLGGAISGVLEVTYSGETMETSQSILSGFMLLIFVFFMVSIVFFINKLPDSNSRDEEGNIISINWLKYLRTPLWFVEWMLLIGILFLSSNLSFAYLGDELFAQILHTLFRVLFGFTPVVIVVWIVWIIARIFQDKEMKKILDRGLFPGEYRI
jgi:hypothetical protein